MSVSSDWGSGGGRPRSKPTQPDGLHFRAARDLGEVTEAWTLVYDAYRRAGLIESNPWQLHTVPPAVQPRSVVVCGRIRGVTVSTLSAYFDHPDGWGLALDRIYPEQLRDLRRRGRVLLEFGLFADRRELIKRSINALLELMRQACFFGVTNGATDGIVGVHPRHAPFYTRVLGFEQIGPERRYPLVQHHRAVLLRIAWHERTSRIDLPRGLRYFRDHPMTGDAFADRCHLDEATVRGTEIEQLLAFQKPNGQAM